LAGPKVEQKGAGTREKTSHFAARYRRTVEDVTRGRKKDWGGGGEGGRREEDRGRLRRERKREWYNRDKQVIDAPQGPHRCGSAQTMAICFCLETRTCFSSFFFFFSFFLFFLSLLLCLYVLVLVAVHR